MAFKAHLSDSPEPLIQGRTYVVCCGEEVANAHWVYMWDEAEMGAAQLPLKGTCRICRNALFEKDKAERYIYGIVNGQELKDSEAL
jgi:hypothetical protein